MFLRSRRHEPPSRPDDCEADVRDYLYGHPVVSAIGDVSPVGSMPPEATGAAESDGAAETDGSSAGAPEAHPPAHLAPVPRLARRPRWPLARRP
jgi:hypothetical protein